MQTSFFSVYKPVYSQSITIQDLEKFIIYPKDDVEKYLINTKYFVLSQVDKWGDSPLKTYTKKSESVYIGGGFSRSNGSFIKDVVYMTEDAKYMVDMLYKITEAGYKFKNRTQKDQEDDADYENDKYQLNVVIKYGKGELSTILIAENP